MACSRMWAMKCSGSSVTVCQARCSWRAPCSVVPKETSPLYCVRSKKRCPSQCGGVISDGQQTIRKAVARCLPGVPHQLCQFHYLREAAKPIFEADRHAKAQLKQPGR